MEKRLSSLWCAEDNEIDGNKDVRGVGFGGCVYFGGLYARVGTQNHRFTFLEERKVVSIAQSVCERALHFGEGDSASRCKPMVWLYGVALLCSTPVRNDVSVQGDRQCDGRRANTVARPIT